MNCCKYTLINKDSKIATFNYRRCDDTMWIYQVSLKPNQIKNIWSIEDTFSTPFTESIHFINKCVPINQNITPTPVQPFISTWRTTSPNETIILPLYSGGNYNFTVNWGDGNIETVTSYLNNSHEYLVAGDYTVTITGIIEGWSFLDVEQFIIVGTPINIINVSQWGNLKIGNKGGSFAFAFNLSLDSVSDIINLNGITNLEYMFYNSPINSVNRINEWDVSNVNNMSNMFASTQLNQPLSGWNVSNVNNMSGMFAGTPFNSDISNWDVGSVTNMSIMFQNTSLFNVDISNWNVSGVTIMTNMFDSAYSFNVDISNWDVSNVINMDYMFTNTLLFNQDLSGWCVTNIPSLPNSFDFNAMSWVLPKPVWGTCP